jgi:hypothetical protein
MRVNYRNLPEQMRRANVAPKPRSRAGTAPTGAIGSVGPATSGLAGALTPQTRAAMIQQPAAGSVVSPVAPASPLLNPGGDAGGVVGKALRGSTGFRSRRK